jgi:hypothetical protein
LNNENLKTMKHFFLTALMLGSLLSGAAAQETPQPAAEPAAIVYEYCELTGTPLFGGNKMTVTVDTGQDRRNMEDTRLRDEETGRIRVFNSMIDALNLLSKDGWEFVQGYASFDGTYLMHHWILKREKK